MAHDSSFLALPSPPHASLLYYLPLLPFFLTPSFSLLYLSIFSLAPLPTSYHLGQATWPIGEYGNQLEADNN